MGGPFPPGASIGGKIRSRNITTYRPTFSGLLTASMRKGRGSCYWTPPSNITLFLSSSCRSARGLGTLLPKRPGAKSLTVLLTSCKGRIVISVCHLYTKLYERNPSFHPIQLREVLVSIFESCLSARGASPYSHYGSKVIKLAAIPL
jgi:hypothetical protein|uniref:Uncharacterized protein n=1 Tax=Picea glauca TaxID=3330 RepID=A0A117NHX2_PICGL|nr:hypothetical protein ABT39_MTgene4390 [Picea glauca]QHR90786.1 hypothetical protein Q903MT_gene4812 [Picea sitchensis]